MEGGLELSKVTLEIFSKLEQQWLHHCQSPKKTCILSIDGCGVGSPSAIFAAHSLILLEDQIRAKSADSQSRIADFFDLIVGTGIGALYAAMLAAADGYKRPLFIARDTVSFVTQNQSRLFKVKATLGIFRRRYRFSGRSMDVA